MALEPDRDQLEIFIEAIFRHATSGFVSLRSFYEGDDKVFRIEPVPISAANFQGYLCDVAEDIARRAAQDPNPVVFCPPLCTFREKRGAAEADLVEGYTLSVECDQDPEAARATLEPLLGPVTIAVRSGGVWQNNGTSYDKMHLHWRLGQPATDQEQLTKLKRAREIACYLVGADPTTAPVCHPLRWPGSWHRKAAPRLCEVVGEVSNFDAEIDLDEVLTKLEPLAPVVVPSADADEGPRTDWGEHLGNILRGEQLHKSLTEMAMKMIVSGMGRRAVVNYLRALMQQSKAPRDERWQNRFDYIPRAVSSARKKLDKETAETAQAQAAQAAQAAQSVQAGASSSGNGATPPTAAAQAGGNLPPLPSWLGAQSAPQPQPTPASPLVRPTIQLVESELPRVVDEAEAALLADIGRQQLYQRGELVVRPARLKLRAADMLGTARETSGWQLLLVTKPYMIETLTRVALFERWNERAKDWMPKNCPEYVADTYLARGGRWKLPVLLRIVSMPFLRRDGSLCDRPGYDPDSALLYILGRGQSFPSIPDAPTMEQAREALKYLDDVLLEEFPFVEKVDRSVALSLILDRHAMMTAPLHAFTAPAAGTGKSLLIDLASLLASGEITPVISQGSNKDETEKRLGAELLSGNSIVSFDNCSSEVDSDLLCQALTQHELRVRELGYSRNVKVPITALFTVNGNNLVIANDLTRRTLLGQLDAGVERPETRTFKRKVDDVARAFRGELVAAALTFLRAWHVAYAAGTRIGIEPMGSFEEWSHRIRCPLLWVGRTDPCDSIQTIRENDPLRSQLNTVLLQWETELGVVDFFTVQQVIDKATKLATGELGIGGSPAVLPRPEFYHALTAVASAKAGKGISNERFGRWLNRNNGKIVGTLRLVRIGNTNGYPTWQVFKV
jgi:hypothetical protein